MTSETWKSYNPKLDSNLDNHMTRGDLPRSIPLEVYAGSLLSVFNVLSEYHIKEGYIKAANPRSRHYSKLVKREGKQQVEETASRYKTEVVIDRAAALDHFETAYGGLAVRESIVELPELGWEAQEAFKELDEKYYARYDATKKERGSIEAKRTVFRANLEILLKNSRTGQVEFPDRF